MSDQSTDEVKEEIEYQTIAEFLESAPPNQLIYISDLSVWKVYAYGGRNCMCAPEIQLHCNHENCNGIRFFRCVSGDENPLKTNEYKFFYVKYRCSNCQRVEKTFSLAAKLDSNSEPQGGEEHAIKWPIFADIEPDVGFLIYNFCTELSIVTGQ